MWERVGVHRSPTLVFDSSSTITTFPGVSPWTEQLGAVCCCGAIWWAACWISPWSPWSGTGWCDLWWSRTCWCPSRSPPRISCWWGRSPELWLLLCTLQGSVSASNHRPPLKNKHTHIHAFHFTLGVLHVQFNAQWFDLWNTKIVWNVHLTPPTVRDRLIRFSG